MGFELVGRVWSADTFPAYVANLNLGWARGITVHHTGTPSLSQRPRGFTAQHLHNLRHFYEVEKGWSAGPHLFIDDDQIWGLSSLQRPGVHARSFNAERIGIEVLGDYDREDPNSGRGKACWDTAAAACRAILDAQGWEAGRINGHRDDPRTHKTCPGSKVDMAAFRAAVASGPGPAQPEPDTAFLDDLKDRLDSISWQVRQMRAAIDAAR